MNKLLTEFIGTFFLVLTICLAVAFAPNMAFLVIGLGLMVMVYMGGHISGAHYNPAVTLAIMMRGKITPTQGIQYMMVQIAGGLAAAAIGWLIVGKTTPIAPNPNFNIGIALLCEILFTFALALVVLNVATVKQVASNSFYGLAIGMTVAVGAATVGGISGGAFNPAVGLSLTILHIAGGKGEFAHVWLYIVGPAIGAALAAVVFRIQHGTGADEHTRPG